MAAATPVRTRFTCATANLEGTGSPEEQYFIKDRSKVRHELSKDLFEATEVLFLQEVSKEFQGDILAYYSFHHTHWPTNTTNSCGILLSTNSFDKPLPIPRFNELIANVEADEGMILEEDRMVCVTSKHKATDSSFLFVSYHGRHTDMTDDNKITLCKLLMKFCESLKKETNTDYLVIGGDFNLSITKFQSDVLPRFRNGRHVMKYQACDFIKNSRTEKGTRVDFIVFDNSRNIELSKVYRYEYKFNPISELSPYFDHDPVVAEFKIPHREKQIQQIQPRHENNFENDYLTIQITEKRLARLDPSISESMWEKIRTVCQSLLDQVMRLGGPFVYVSEPNLSSSAQSSSSTAPSGNEP